MSDRAGTRPARSEPRGTRWTLPHNPVVLRGPEPRAAGRGLDTDPAAQQRFVVRLEGLERELAHRLQREVGLVGGTASLREEPGAAAVVAVVGLGVPHLDALRARLLATTGALLAIAEELALAMRLWERGSFELRCGARALVCGDRPLVMGILNCTPDSFYATGRTMGPGAVSRALAMVADGADLIDIGGESTRPGSTPVPAAEEIHRVVPVLEALAGQVEVPISIDTTKAEVARAALQAGATMINDISGLTFDPEIAEVAAEAGAPLVLMHTRGRPGQMYEHARYEDVVVEMIGELRGAVARAREAGVAEEGLVVDPGIGFAKEPQHSLACLRRLASLRSLGLPILFGPSRKSFIGAVLDLPAEERLEGTMAAVAAAVLAGAHIVRVHDVGPVRRAADMAAAIRSEGEGWIS